MPANQLHPVYHLQACQAGSRVDIDRVLPATLDDTDLEELLEKLSEPPRFKERIAPVSTIIGTDVVRGRNWTDMMMKAYRIYFRLFSSMGFYLRQAMVEKFDERGMLPFTSMSMDPETLHLMIEMDYEQGENTYGSLLELLQSGVISPCATTPFHALLPLMHNEFDQRLALRVGLLMHWEEIVRYHEYLETVGSNTQFIVPFWFPECAFSARTLEILHEEFQAITREHRVRDPHLLIMLDTAQVQPTDIDVLMKSWNVVKVGQDNYVSVVFRDRSFSEWVTYSNPSVKKLIDRTIAKVDSGLNERGVDYCWSHFEELEALTFTNKSTNNYDQKITKLAQLSYMPMSPDMFVRRKMDGIFGKATHEPQEIELKDNTAWSDWHTNPSLGRWQGVLDSNAFFKLVDMHRPYTRRTRGGKVVESGPQAWKPAWTATRQTISKAVKGDPETLQGGAVEVLAGLVGAKDPKVNRKNVQEFLMFWSHAHWREIFLQRDLSEADVDVQALVDQYLFRGLKKSATEQDYAIAAAAAQAYYFAMESHRSFATAFENMDNRLMYQSAMMTTLALCNMIAVYGWVDRVSDAKAFIELMKTELLDFSSAYDRYELAELGVTRQEWDESLKSQVDESPLNVVERATRRVAARHLRPLGYRKDFTKEDEFITTNVGHVWTVEIENTNYKWENKVFCGLREE
jgi:hypothetical protein